LHHSASFMDNAIFCSVAKKATSQCFNHMMVDVSCCVRRCNFATNNRGDASGNRAQLGCPATMMEP
jgi:hypothetical protein